MLRGVRRISGLLFCEGRGHLVVQTPWREDGQVRRALGRGGEGWSAVQRGSSGQQGKGGEGSADLRRGAVCPTRLPAERSEGSG